MPERLPTTEITVRAPSKTVWEALTKPELIKKYLMGANVKTDWKVGSPLVYTGEYKGKAYEEKGVIKKIEPGKLLQATHFSSMSGKEDKPENYALVTYELHEKDGATVVSVSQDGSPAKRASKAARRTGWSFVLKGLKATVEG